jgi:DNA polymerase III alpha subunit (gram-positive type)
MPRTKKALYASFDVETDGSNPMQHSMRSLGIVLMIEGKGNHEPCIVDTFYRTITPRHDTFPDPTCITDFWDRHPIQWKNVNTDTISPTMAMLQLSQWLNKFTRHYIIKWVASPASFDWMFLKCYYEMFGPTTKMDIGFFCHDLVSLLRTFAVMHNIKNVTNLRRFLGQPEHPTHHALDDATNQGYIYMRLRTLLSGDLQLPWSFIVAT